MHTTNEIKSLSREELEIIIHWQSMLIDQLKESKEIADKQNIRYAEAVRQLIYNNTQTILKIQNRQG